MTVTVGAGYTKSKNKQIVGFAFRNSVKLYLSFDVVGEFGCSEEAVTIAAMSQIQNVFVSPTGQKHTSVSIEYL